MNIDQNICIIGSGLAAVAAADALILRGYKPVIFDLGNLIDSNRLSIIKRMSKVKPINWADDDSKFIFDNHLVNESGLPIKLAFGSDFFYGKELPDWKISSKVAFPPFSFAKGGLSNGWGSSALPANSSDLLDWPEEARNLDMHYQTILENLPYSAVNDKLSKHFPIFKNLPIALTLDEPYLSIHKDLHNKFANSSNILYGQARNLVNANNDSNGCQYCGKCMDGCVYHSIYKASDRIDQLLSEKKIDYLPNILVTEIIEKKNKIYVYCCDNGIKKIVEFDRVFLAAGAVNSTRILLKSKKIFNQNVLMKAVPGIAVPFFRIKRSNSSWPNLNTMSGIFLEYKFSKLSKFWSHCQISTPNDLVSKVINGGSSSIIKILYKLLHKNLYIANITMHSTHGNGYILNLENSGQYSNGILHSRRESPKKARSTLYKNLFYLSRIMYRIGCFPLIPFAKDSTNSIGYHIGGSLPMKDCPILETDTDIFGTPTGYSLLHIIDSSIFPSIPGTTIGLLSMANATRIASTVRLN